MTLYLSYLINHFILVSIFDARHLLGHDGLLFGFLYEHLGSVEYFIIKKIFPLGIAPGRLTPAISAPDILPLWQLRESPGPWLLAGAPPRVRLKII